MKPIRISALLLPLLLLAACESGGGDSGDQPKTFSIITSSLPAGIEGVNYSAQLSSDNGVAPVTWVFAPGYSPPAWLSLSTTGGLSGVPSASGSVSVEVQATDSSMTPVSITRTLPLEIYGMTTNVTFIIDAREDVMRVPNAALRFRPAGAAPAGHCRRFRGHPQRFPSTAAGAFIVVCDSAGDRTHSR